MYQNEINRVFFLEDYQLIESKEGNFAVLKLLKDKSLVLEVRRNIKKIITADHFKTLQEICDEEGIDYEG